MKLLPAFSASLAVVLLSACNSFTPTGASGSTTTVPGSGGPGPGVGATSCTFTTTTPVAAAGGGGNTRMEVPVQATGDTMVIQLFEPATLEPGKHYPLVLEGHGYGGSRQTENSGFIKQLTDGGYYVISIDQRGFGESSGTVRVMDPEFEGLNLVAILDWAESLPGLRRCQEDGRMVVGSYGGSYGGMYQFLLLGTDQAKQRLRVIVPDITPHDLTYALTPNGVVKSGWGLALVAGGEANFRRDALPTRQDPILIEALLNAVLSNSFDASSTNFFKYHSVAYFCGGLPFGPQSFLNPMATPDQGLIESKPFPKTDALISQGVRDTLFNLNDGVNNLDCMRALGGDVRFITHESGHILPVSPSAIPGFEDNADPFYAALTFPSFQDAGTTQNCGSINYGAARFAWFEEKLQGKTGLIGPAMANMPADESCLSLGDQDAVAVKQIKRGGTPFTIDASIPQFNSVLGVGGALLGNAVREQILATQPIPVPAGAVAIAGIPQLEITIEGLSGMEMAECPTPLNLAACDPIYFLGLGKRAQGTQRWDLIDDQLTPVRGFGTQQLDMTGISERLNAGDEMALLIYGFHAQFPVTWSRDLLVPAATLSGIAKLPFLMAADITRELKPAPSTGGGNENASPLPIPTDALPIPGGLPGAGSLPIPGGAPSLPGAGSLPIPVPGGGGVPAPPSGNPLESLATMLGGENCDPLNPPSCAPTGLPVP